jgi:HEAT repeat protein
MFLTHLFRRLSPPRSGLIGAAVLAAAIVLTVRGLSPADALPDPVARLQDALQGKGNLKAVSADVRSLGDLSRALLLKEWRGTGPEVEVRTDLADRFRKGVEQVVKSGPNEARLAVARLIGEMANSVRTLSLDRQFFRGPLGAMTPDLIRLTEPSNPVAVRQAAAQSLGQMEGQSNLLHPAFKKLLTLDNPPAVRVAAAESLGTLVQIAYKELTGVSTGGGALSAIRDSSRLPNRIGLVQRARLVLSLAQAGLDQRQPVAVRRASVENYRIITTVLADSATDLTTPETPLLIGLTPEEQEMERQRIEKMQTTLNNELRGLFEDFKSQAPALATASLDSDVDVRIAARRVLENLAQVRRLLANNLPIPIPEPKPESKKGVSLPRSTRPIQTVAWSRSVVQQGAAGGPSGAATDPLGEALRLALPDLRKGLTDPNATARLAAVAALEAMGKDAESVIPALVDRLEDSDIFVSWATARTLGKMAPLQAKLVVPPLGKIVLDPRGDLGPRLAAAQALENYGPDARTAVGSLREVVRRGFAPQESPWPVAYAYQPANRDAFRGNADLRIAAMRALRAVGTGAKSAIPDIGQTLATDPEATVRRVAAEVLGGFGKDASSQAPILRDHLDDVDPEVRRNASEALLKILGK